MPSTQIQERPLAIALVVAFVLVCVVGCPSDRSSQGPDLSANGEPDATSPSPASNPGRGGDTSNRADPAGGASGQGPNAVTSAPHREVHAPRSSHGPVVASREESPKAGHGLAAPSAEPDPLFVGWAKPDAALFITGRQHGYIEPCGCTGFANAKGGLTRRMTLKRQLEEKGWNVVALDIGNQVRRSGRQAELKFQTTVDVLKKMHYAALAFGPEDLRLSFGEVYAAVADLEGEEGPFVSANVTLFDVPSHYRVVETDAGKVGVTAILGKAEQQEVGNVDEIEFRDPEAALRDVVKEMKAASCDVFVLLAHTSIEKSKELARTFPEFDFVVTAGGAGEPTFEPEEIEGSKAQLIQVGTKGMYVGVVGLYADRSLPPRYERVTLDARFKDSEEVLARFADYQNMLKELGLDGLAVRPVRHPSGRSYVGSEACRDCHEVSYEIFENTPHFEATLSLARPTERSEIPRHFDPECLSCHVTGWNPQGHFPYESGYVDFEDSARLHSTGCESCHGPGSAHVAAENGEIDVTEEETEQLRRQMRLTLEEARESKCFECHDLDNSPAFQKEGAFEEYWEQVKHYEKE